MKEVVVRFPLIPGVNDSEKDVAELAEFLLSVGIREITILPYHKAGIESYTELTDQI